MEADLDRFWGVDLLDYWRTPRRLSTRKLMNRVENIPIGQGSAVRSLDGPEWTTEMDLLDTIRRRYTHANFEPGEDPGPHVNHPAHRADDDGPSADVIAHVARLKAEREAAIAAGEIA